MSDQRPLPGGPADGPDVGDAVGTVGGTADDDALAEAVLGEGDPAEVVTADIAAVDGVDATGGVHAAGGSDAAGGVDVAGGVDSTGSGARSSAGTSDESRDLATLAEELGACAAGVPGVAQVRPRPGFAALAAQVVQGARRWRDLRTVVGGGAPAAPAAPGASRPVVGLAVSDAEVRITLDVAVADGHAGPAVARAVVAELLAHPALADLPDAWVDLRIVSIG